MILPIAHKYCMETIEADIMHALNRSPGFEVHNAFDAEMYVDLMVASRIIGSEVRYQEALQHLISSEAELTLDQAKRIGIEAAHAVLTAALSAAKAQLTKANTALIDTKSELTASITTLTKANNTLTANNAALTTNNTTLTTSVANSDNRRCRHCSYSTNWSCASCCRTQV